jgi:hypothetical protein
MGPTGFMHFAVFIEKSGPVVDCTNPASTTSTATAVPGAAKADTVVATPATKVPEVLVGGAGYWGGGSSTSHWNDLRANDQYTDNWGLKNEHSDDKSTKDRRDDQSSNTTRGTSSRVEWSPKYQAYVSHYEGTDVTEKNHQKHHQAMPASSFGGTKHSNSGAFGYGLWSGGSQSYVEPKGGRGQGNLVASKEKFTDAW